MVVRKPLILICDDDHSLCEIIENALNYDGYATEIVHTGGEALRRLETDHHDLILLDLKLPDMSGLDTLKRIQDLELPVVAVMISGEGDIHTAVEATKYGAFDFLEKPLDADRVLVTIKNALDRGRLEREKANLLQSVCEQYRMIGTSDPMKEIHYLILKAAKTSSKVLIEGENGTGKELVARAIHHQSSRAFAPFVAVNCAALPENLIESELFGHKKGSFTGAIADKPGRFQLADNGTIFLDEIGDMSLMTQAKVLRILEEGQVEMIGGSEPVAVDVRVITATNKDLQKEMNEGRFREDLYFRLNVLSIKMPALRDRKDDIPLLITHFTHLFCHEHGIRMKTVMQDAIDRFLSYDWPGNVRELRNVIEKIVILIEGDHIHGKDVDAFVQRHSRRSDEIPRHLSFREAKGAFERRFIHEKLQNNGWNITRAAEEMQIPRTYLHKKMNKLQIRQE
ncbi:sigma-54-dependent Fis family transcriptional regulator [bacterium]|nr:sigma-54-dependent Fis family transcriptional regulator [bacterium]